MSCLRCFDLFDCHGITSEYALSCTTTWACKLLRLYAWQACKLMWGECLYWLETQQALNLRKPANCIYMKHLECSAMNSNCYWLTNMMSSWASCRTQNRNVFFQQVTVLGNSEREDGCSIQSSVGQNKAIINRVDLLDGCFKRSVLRPFLICSSRCLDTRQILQRFSLLNTRLKPTN